SQLSDFPNLAETMRDHTAFNSNADADPRGDRPPPGETLPPSSRQGAPLADRVLLEHANAAARSLALDEIGNLYSCWRLRNENDAHFSFRLAVHIQEKIIHDEEQLENILSLSRHPTCNGTE